MCEDFKKLSAYEQALIFSDRIYEVTGGFPRPERKRFGGSLRNACVMVAEKIAEGIGRHYSRDRRRSFSLARGAVYRCISLVEIARRQGVLDAETAGRLQKMCRILGGTIEALIDAPARRR
jgi:four helix bundle protein